MANKTTSSSVGKTLMSSFVTSASFVAMVTALAYTTRVAYTSSLFGNFGVKSSGLGFSTEDYVTWSYSSVVVIYESAHFWGLLTCVSAIVIVQMFMVKRAQLVLFIGSFFLVFLPTSNLSYISVRLIAIIVMGFVLSRASFKDKSHLVVWYGLGSVSWFG